MSKDPHWKELFVTTEDNSNIPIETAIETLDISGMVLDEYSGIIEWNKHFIHRENETPDWDTPRCRIDWSGLPAFLYRVKQLQVTI